MNVNPANRRGFVLRNSSPVSFSTIVCARSTSRSSRGAKAGSFLNMAPNRPSASRSLVVRSIPRNGTPCRPPSGPTAYAEVGVRPSIAPADRPATPARNPRRENGRSYGRRSGRRSSAFIVLLLVRRSSPHAGLVDREVPGRQDAAPRVEDGSGVQLALHNGATRQRDLEVVASRRCPILVVVAHDDLETAQR